MKKINLIILTFLSVIFTGWLTGKISTSNRLMADNQPIADSPESKFETAVEIIKKYEGLHSSRHWPLVGYGHLVLPGEKYSRSKALSEKEADALLRKDLLKNCAVFRSYGKDSLLLGVLAYNIGSGNVKRSSVIAKLKQGNRDIKNNYIAHCRYKGKEHAQIKKRRVEEFEKLFIYDSDSLPISQVSITKIPSFYL